MSPVQRIPTAPAAQHATVCTPAWQTPSVTVPSHHCALPHRATLPSLAGGASSFLARCSLSPAPTSTFSLSRASSLAFAEGPTQQAMGGSTSRSFSVPLQQCTSQQDPWAELLAAAVDGEGPAMVGHMGGEVRIAPPAMQSRAYLSRPHLPFPPDLHSAASASCKEMCMQICRKALGQGSTLGLLCQGLHYIVPDLLASCFV